MALAFVTAAGVGVQAREPESLTEVTEISASAFQALKPEGPVTAEEKREVIGNILLEAGVPAFMVEKMDDQTAESFYNSSGMEIQLDYFLEKAGGGLNRITKEQHERIAAYNERSRNKIKKDPIIAAGLILPENEGGVSTEISNLTHALIVGGPVDGRRICWASAGWNVSPLCRFTDFIGISSSRSTILIDTAVAGMDYTIETHDGDKEKRETYEFNSTDFTESNYGVGKSFDIPSDPLIYSSAAQQVVFCPCKDIVLMLTVWEQDPNSVHNVISNYFHQYLALTFGAEISGDGAGFSISPQIAYDISDVSGTVYP